MKSYKPNKMEEEVPVPRQAVDEEETERKKSHIDV